VFALAHTVSKSAPTSYNLSANIVFFISWFKLASEIPSVFKLDPSFLEWDVTY